MSDKQYRKTSRIFKHPYEVDFAAGVPESTERRNSAEVFLYPEELIDKTCGGCVRCELRDHGDKDGYHCCMRDWNIDITPEHKACVAYWDREENERAEREKAEAVEKRRRELWAIYAERDPIKVPIVNDGYGLVPKCPICGEMPYSTEQCHWCGQRFIQDAETVEYATPKLVDYRCPTCGKVGKAHISKVNGHKNFFCDNCGFAFIE